MSSSDLDSVIDQWLRWDPDPATRKEVEEMRAAGATEALKSRFKDRIKFGTAGLRGRMQAGPSSLNLLTVLQASQGLAMRLEKEFQENPSANIKVRDRNLELRERETAFYSNIHPEGGLYRKRWTSLQ